MFFSVSAINNTNKSAKALSRKKISAANLLMSVPMLAHVGFVLDLGFFNITNGTAPDARTPRWVAV